MSKSILIIGESGSGKTSSMRNLKSTETYYIDCDKKGLNWKGWKTQYNLENKNYFATSDVSMIEKILDKVSTERKEIKNIVIDTLNGIMIDDEFKKMSLKGYDKWLELAYSIYGIIDKVNTLREDLNVICIMHSETDSDEQGNRFTRAKTSGKKLNKIVVESKFTNVLLAKCIDGKYIFETHSKNSTAKTPIGAFEEDTIENDITQVLKALEEF